MRLYISKAEKRKRFLAALLPALIPLAAAGGFLWALTLTGAQTDQSRQQTLYRALNQGAVRVYALTGAYPETLAELLAAAHITYDPESFIVEYIPQGSNLPPTVFVSPMEGGAPP